MWDKYKRPITLAVAVFCLVTFSISGPVMGWVSRITARNRAGTITLDNGQTVQLTADDMTYGRLLARTEGYPAVSLILSALSDPSKPRLAARSLSPLGYAILRRVAVESGIDVSDAEVRAALDYVRREPQMSRGKPQPKVDDFTMSQLVRLGSVTQLYAMMREAIRVSMFVQLEMLGGVDFGDSALAKFIKDKRKRIDMSYVAFPAAPFREELEKSPPSGEVLTKWLEGLDDDDAIKTPFVDPVHTSFDAVAILYDQADPKDFAKELEGTEIGDAEIESRYNADKDTLYRKPEKPGDNKEGGGKEGGGKDGVKEDPNKKDPKPATTKQGKDKQGPQKKGTDKQGGNDEDGGLLAQGPTGPDKPANQASETGGTKPAKQGSNQPGPVKPAAGGQAAGGQAAGGQAAGGQGPGQIGPQAPKSDQDQYLPLDAALKQKIRRKLELEAALRKLHDEARVAQSESRASGENKEEKKENEKKGENNNPKKNEKKKPFVLRDWFKSIAKDRKGLVLIEGGKPQAPEKYETLDKLGQWTGFHTLSLVKKGDLSGVVQTAEKGAFFFQVRDTEENVLKPLAEIRDDALDAYYKKKSAEMAKERADTFRKLVREKAEKIDAAKVADLRKKNEKAVADAFAEWKAGQEDKIKKLRGDIASGNLPSNAVQYVNEQIAKLEKSIANSDDKRKEIKEEEHKKLEKEITDLIHPQLAQAMQEAVEEKKYELVDVPVFYRDEKSMPLFSLRKDDAEKFLKQQDSVVGATEEDKDSLKVGDVSQVIEDPGETLAFYVVRMNDILEGDDASVTRYQMVTNRPTFTQKRAMNVLEFGYGLTALKKRYNYQESAAVVAERAAKGKDKGKDQSQ